MKTLIVILMLAVMIVLVVLNAIVTPNKPFWFWVIVEPMCFGYLLGTIFVKIYEIL